MNRVCCLAAAVVAAVAAPAHAHFVWAIPAADGVEVSFAEGPHRGADYLLDRIEHAEGKLHRGADATELAFSPRSEDEAGWLAAGFNAPAFTASVDCQYGVFDHGPKPLLLDYYAKAIRAPSWEVAAKTPVGKQALEIVPIADQNRAVKVLWAGEPIPAADVFLHAGDDEGTQLGADEAGVVRLPEAADGRWAVRASLTREGAGELDGAAYEEEMHVATLVLTIDATAERQPADDALVQARENRAVWDDFPGFSSAIRVSVDDETITGRASISEYGEVELELPEGPARDWVQRTLSSLVGHRMPTETIGQGGVFLDAEERHPLGRKVELFGDGMGSVYRLKDDVVTEVNRDGRGGRFQISVLDVHRNAEGKYLPHAYAVTFWDAETGAIRSTTSTLNTWRRHENWDLPLVHLEVTATADGSVAREIEFSDVQLGEQ